MPTEEELITAVEEEKKNFELNGLSQFDEFVIRNKNVYSCFFTLRYVKTKKSGSQVKTEP